MQSQAITRAGIQDERVETRSRLLWLSALAFVFLFAQAIMVLAKPESLAPLAEKISPSVVNITTSTVVEGRTGPQGIVPEGSPFEDFFRDFRERNNEGDRPRPRRSSAQRAATAASKCSASVVQSSCATCNAPAAHAACSSEGRDDSTLPWRGRRN